MSIKHKVNKWWEQQHLQTSYVNSINPFPLFFNLPKVSEKLLAENFSIIKTEINALYHASKTNKKYGFQIEYTTINYRKIGAQKLPIAIYFETQEDLLKYLGKTQIFNQFCQYFDETKKTLPQLITLLQDQPKIMMDNLENWSQILRVCQYFLQNPLPNVYLRQLDIVGVDTKFIEKNFKTLKLLLDTLLPESHRLADINTLSHHGFERRFGLRHPESLIRFRFLDNQLIPLDFPVCDCALPISEFTQINIPARRVFITENKINGLSFPNIKQAIVIFGLGYGITSLTKIQWLKQKEIYYWGDLDSHGFAILSQLRSYFPQTKSLLMDEPTWKKFLHLCVTEPKNQRCTATLPNLKAPEQTLYQKLQSRAELNKPSRLEQERIPFNYCLAHIQQIQYDAIEQGSF